MLLILVWFQRFVKTVGTQLPESLDLDCRMGLLWFFEKFRNLVFFEKETQVKFRLGGFQILEFWVRGGGLCDGAAKGGAGSPLPRHSKMRSPRHRDQRGRRKAVLYIIDITHN